MLAHTSSFSVTIFKRVKAVGNDVRLVLIGALSPLPGAPDYVCYGKHRIGWEDKSELTTKPTPSMCMAGWDKWIVHHRHHSKNPVL